MNRLLAYLKYFQKRGMVTFNKKQHEDRAKFIRVLDEKKLSYYEEHDSKMWTIWRVEE